MSRRLEESLRNLQEDGIIDSDTATKIEVYLNGRVNDNSNRQLLVFSLLGSVLVGLGIILIIAHNWDNFTRTTKAFFAFLPLLLGQAACLYALLKRRDNPIWCEGTSVFLFFAIGACIAMISQIYNLPGDMGSFLFTWMALVLPLVYLLRSSATSILFLAGITWYACQVGYWEYNSSIPFLYWLMLLLALPYYINLIREHPKGNFTQAHHWIVPLSVIITLGTLSGPAEELMLIAYMSLFSLIFLIGRNFITTRKEFFNSYQILGSAGILVLLLVFSFQENWRDIIRFNMPLGEMILTPEFLLSLLIAISAGCLLVWQLIKERKIDYNITGAAHLLFIAAFMTAYYDPMYSMLLTNIYLLFLGVFIIREGASTDNLIIMNYGLLIITALIICRFFDVKISFIIRGMLFLGVGAAFFLLNYRIIQKKKTV